jgi:Putative polyhydroxyalkanoic acid system protein (PHA_gran_rgn)
MANFNISIPHQLTQEEALKRIKDRFAQVKSQYSGKIGDVHEEWNGNVGRFSSSSPVGAVSVTLTVTPTEVVIEGELPAMATFFKGKIESGIRKELDALLG